MEKLSQFANNVKAEATDGAEKTEEQQEIATIAQNLDIFKLFKKYTDKIIEE